MKPIRKTIRFIAAFLMVNTLYMTFLPGISYALTSGPTAPEATSFEPIDTTDMVNLQTGDFTYNLPLLEVPGPAGGYPLSLSYHAGIMPNEEASWAGLGWTLNPGAINRTVNGFADDHINVNTTDRFYWKGGERHQGEIGITYGISGVGGVTAAISVGHDTYEGFGVGGSLGINLGVKLKSLGLGISGTGGIDPWGNGYSSVGIGISASKGAKGSAMSLTGSIGVSTNFKSISTNAGVSVSYKHPTADGVPEPEDGTGSFKKTSTSLLGASISTGGNGTRASLAVGGGSSSINNSKAGKISSSSFGFTLPLPFLHLGYQTQRYWIDEMESIDTNGVFGFPNEDVDRNWLDDHAYDVYSLYDIYDDEAIIRHEQPETVRGGTLPNFDDYRVNAQGVSGSIRPYLFKAHMARQNVRRHINGDDAYLITHYPTGYTDNPIQFRFMNDFSNRFTYEPGTFNYGPGTENGPLEYNFDWDELESYKEKTGETGDDGISNNHLAGSKHIDFLTNSEILNNSLKVDKIGFIDTKSTGYDRNYFGNDLTGGTQIGAFVVTNETGVKYHFSLPVYSYDEYQYSENIDKEGGLRFNEIKKPEQYAHTWLLTGVTGPDFIDRGVIGEFDADDWGYWVEFDYGKWTNQYAWRNPDLDFHKDLDAKFQNYSVGKKEVYYLDAIKTKTHTALFVKDIRADAKSTLSFLESYQNGNVNQYDQLKDFAKRSDKEKEGGYIPTAEECVCDLRDWNPSGDEEDLLDRQRLDYYARPVSSLKLSSVYLFDNTAIENLGIDKTQGDQFSQTYSYDWETTYDELPSNYPNCEFTTEIFESHLPDFVLDVHDISSIESTALRVIDFSTTNEVDEGALVPETINSFDYDLVDVAVPSSEAMDYPLKGKLTLNAVNFRGKSGANMVPPIKFNYDLNDPNSGSSTLTTVNATDRTYKFGELNTGLEKGDIIKFESNNKPCYGLVSKILGATHHVRILGKKEPSNGTINWEETKNPPYDIEAVDNWGMYKSDHITSTELAKEFIKYRSEVSSKSVDAWSLRNIESSIGADIDIQYASDEYCRPVYSTSLSLEVLNIVPQGTQNCLITIPNAGQLAIKDFVDLKCLLVSMGKLLRVGESADAKLPFPYRYNYEFKDNEVVSFNNESITIKNEELNGLLNQIREQEDYTVVYETNQLQDAPFGEPKQIVTYVAQPYVLAGNVSLSLKDKNFGGGIRVEEIGISNSVTGKRDFTSYSYENDDLSSGTTSYEPSSLWNAHYNWENIHEDYEDRPYSVSSTDQAKSFFTEDYERFLKGDVNKILAISRELPAPGIYYEYVTVQEGSNINGNLPSSTRYQFEVLKDYMVETEYTNSGYRTWSGNYQGTPYQDTNIRNVTIKDYTSRIGNLKSVTVMGSSNQPLIKTKYKYGHTGPNDENGITPDNEDYENLLKNQFSDQGLIEESFIDARISRFGGPYSTEWDTYHLLGVITKTEDYPSFLIETETENYKTGISVVDRNLAFDFYSGEVTKTLSTDGYGNSYVTETIPAYKAIGNPPANVRYDGIWYSYKDMGLAIYGGKNMLTQTAANYTFKVNNTNPEIKEALVSANVQTWNDHWRYRTENGAWNQNDAADDPDPVWRKQASYSWKGDDRALTEDGLYPYQNSDGSFVYFEEFMAWEGDNPTSDQWQKKSEVTLFNLNSLALEANDINAQYAATKTDAKQEKIYATSANTRYTEFAYSGAEDDPINGYFGGEVKKVGQLESGGHTGGFSLTSNWKAFSFTATATRPLTLRTNFWCNKSDAKIKYTINGGATQNAILKPVRQAEDWYLIEAILPEVATGDQVEVWCEAASQDREDNFDDFRVHPIDAPMTSYVYNKWGELSHVLDNNNLYTEYEYDAAGRLTNTYKESFKYGVKQISKVDYNYGRKYYDALDQIDADFTVSLHGVVDQAMRFQYGNNTSLGGTTTYTWNWGDGTSYTGATNPKYHSYTSQGTYDAGLIVNNTINGVKASSKTINIYDSQFSFNIKNDGETSYLICSENSTNNIAQFDLSTLSDNVCPYDYLTWKYAVNNLDGSYSEFGSGTSATFTINDKTEGTYYIKCEGRDKCGYQVSSTDVLQLSLTDGGNCQ